MVQNIYKDLLNQGITGIWGDLGEPEVHPSTILHGNGKTATKFTIFTEWIGQNYERKFCRNFTKCSSVYFDESWLFWCSKKRLSFLGVATFLEVGAIAKSQPDIVLQMGLQGIAFMHSDLGGFAGKNEDDELYARWFAIRRFQPNLQTSR